MVKTALATPDFPPGLPPHAQDDINADPAMLTFWTRWAAVGEAKDRHAAARHEWVLASHQFRECNRAASAKAGKAIPRNQCGCGGCLRDVRIAYEQVQATDAAIRTAIEEFKS